MDSTHQPVNSSTQPINLSTHQLINPSTHQIIDAWLYLKKRTKVHINFIAKSRTLFFIHRNPGYRLHASRADTISRTKTACKNMKKFNWLLPAIRTKANDRFLYTNSSHQTRHLQYSCTARCLLSSCPQPPKVRHRK